MPLSFVPFFISVLCCQPQRVGYRPLPSERTVRIQASLWGVCGGESGTGADFFRAPGFFPASIISPMFSLHTTFIYSSCYKSSLISRWAPSFSHYMRTTAKYKYHKQKKKSRINVQQNFPAVDLLSFKHSGFNIKISSLFPELEGLFQLSTAARHSTIYWVIRIHSIFEDQISATYSYSKTNLTSTPRSSKFLFLLGTAHNTLN